MASPLARLRRLWWLLTQGEKIIMATAAENTRLRALTDALRARVKALTDSLAASEAGKPSAADMAETQAILDSLEALGKDPSNPLPEPVLPTA